MVKDNFKDYTFQPIMLDVISQLGFKEPTEIQDKVMPLILKGESIIGQSFTGSGKTHAYLLPLFERLNIEKNEVQHVITAPTRELATQLYEEVKKIIKYANMEDTCKAQLLIGGTDKQRSIEKLKKIPHIIVGTPGRILDLVNENALSIYKARSLVIDEADLMLDMGFIEDIDKLLVRTNDDLQLLVFSATIPKRLQHFFKRYLANPTYIQVDRIVPENMEHVLIPKKHRELSFIINEISNVIQPYLALIFVNGKEMTETLATELQKHNIDAAIIHGGLSSRERKRVLKDIKNLRYQYIIATDLASRGIDIEGISHVINAEMPKEEHFYLHRVGRTARAGLHGMAISIYHEDDIPLLEKLEKQDISFEFKDVSKGEWRNSKRWNVRAQRFNNKTDIDQQAWRRVKKPKKIKPGYKKKMKQQQEHIKKGLLKKSSHNKGRKR